MRWVKAALLIVAVAVLVLFACFVWPTKYRYDHVTINGTTIPVRFNRISGKGEIWDYETRWWYGTGDPVR